MELGRTHVKIAGK